MLAIASAAFFVVPAQQEVQAQSGSIVNLCFNDSTGQFDKETGGVCPANFRLLRAPRINLGFCILRNGGKYYATEPLMVDGRPKLNSSGTKCLDENNQEDGDFKSFTEIAKDIEKAHQTTNPPTTPPIIPPTGGNPTTPGGSGTGTSTGTPPSSVGCETGFHKVGPLCVPNSPFNNGNSITGKKSVGDVAAQIISWLLYFAGIVAVIMAIIGGYQVMTAAGNATQSTNGRKTLTNAIIGLAIIILSYVIIQAVMNFVT